MCVIYLIECSTCQGHCGNFVDDCANFKLDTCFDRVDNKNVKTIQIELCSDCRIEIGRQKRQKARDELNKELNKVTYL